MCLWQTALELKNDVAININGFIMVARFHYISVSLLCITSQSLFLQLHIADIYAVNSDLSVGLDLHLSK